MSRFNVWIQIHHLNVSKNDQKQGKNADTILNHMSSPKSIEKSVQPIFQYTQTHMYSARRHLLY